MNWQPTASIDTLKKRQKILADIRSFFFQRELLEVETPLLSAAGTPDRNIESLTTGRGYLQTSPEYPMKRLLAAGAGPIFQICKVFRDNEISPKHNIEFTMLEWYQPGWTDVELMVEVIELLNHLGLCWPVRNVDYREIMSATTGLDPFAASITELQHCAARHANRSCDHFSRDQCLDLLMAIVTEPSLNKGEITIIRNYPASQAALAVKEQDNDGYWVARRFEVYLGNIELANGYFELTHADELAQRFDEENNYRQGQGQKVIPTDQNLLLAMQSGLPLSSGIALGVDRLIMTLLGKQHIKEVISFEYDRA